MRTHFTTKNEFEKQYILYNYSDQLDNFLKKIIELTQIIGGRGGVLFLELIFKILNIYIVQKYFQKLGGGPPP